MIGPRWRKVLGDLWSYKTRTLLVVLSIAVGVFAIGMISGTQVILMRDMQASYLAIDPPAAIIGLERFDDELPQAIRRMPEVDEAEGRAGLSVRVQVGQDSWRTLNLQAIPNFRDIRINKISPVEGAWPPADRHGGDGDRAPLAVGQPRGGVRAPGRAAARGGRDADPARRYPPDGGVAAAQARRKKAARGGQAGAAAGARGLGCETYWL